MSNDRTGDALTRPTGEFAADPAALADLRPACPTRRPAYPNTIWLDRVRRRGYARHCVDTMPPEELPW